MSVYRPGRLGTNASRRARRVRSVTVDGRALPLRDVFYADTRRGVVRMFLRNEHGGLFPIASGGVLVSTTTGPCRLATAELRGRVAVRLERHR